MWWIFDKVTGITFDWRNPVRITELLCMQEHEQIDFKFRAKTFFAFNVIIWKLLLTPFLS